MIRGVSFDLEGTLVDVEKAHHEGFLRAAREFSYVFTLEEAVEKFPSFVGGGDIAVSKEMVKVIRIEEKTFLQRKQYYYNILLKELHLELRPGAAKVINWLKRNKFGLAVGSLTPTGQAQIILEKAKIIQIFGRDNIVLREDVRNVKPDPEVWLKTAKLAGVDPQEQIVFDDSPVGIKAARAAGSIPVAVPVYKMPDFIKRLVGEGAVRIFMSWKELNIAALIDNLNRGP